MRKAVDIPLQDLQGHNQILQASLIIYIYKAYSSAGKAHDSDTQHRQFVWNSLFAPTSQHQNIFVSDNILAHHLIF